MFSVITSIRFGLNSVNYKSDGVGERNISWNNREPNTAGPAVLRTPESGGREPEKKRGHGRI